MKLPRDVQILYTKLIEDIEQSGPIQKKWPHFSDLGKNKYHCHLNYRYVACWTYDKKTKTCIVEVTYAGSRENAPY